LQIWPAPEAPTCTIFSGDPIADRVGVTAASAAFVFLVIGMLLRSRRNPVVSGREELIGAPGEALEEIEGEGWARVHGERWRVRTSVPLKRGQALRVAAIDGLVLEVTPGPGDGKGG